MSEFIDREKAIANIKAAYCCGCEHYNGVRCRACQIMDAMDVLEDEPAVVPDVQRWRKTAEDPPKMEDTDPRSTTVLTVQVGIDFVTAWEWNIVADFPEEFPVWMPMPKRPGERPQKLYWRERACTTICPVCGYECNDDYYLDKFCPGCGTRLWFDEEEAEHDQPDM
jgi:hypothetical protein